MATKFSEVEQAALDKYEAALEECVAAGFVIFSTAIAYGVRSKFRAQTHVDLSALNGELGDRNTFAEAVLLIREVWDQEIKAIQSAAPKPHGNK